MADSCFTSKIEFLSGDEALARGAFEEGARVAASYPGTPASEILAYLSQFKEVDAQWSVNEKVAFEVALAASIGGLRSLYASKHVGLNVAMDAFMTSAYTGVGAGFIVVSCDDPGIHSSQNEQDNRLLAKAAKVPVIEPSSPSEAKEFVAAAFSLSEEFDTPVLMRMTTRIAHTKENVAIGSRREIPARPFKVNVPKYVMVPRNAYQRHIDLEARLKSLAAYAETTPLNKVETGDKKIGFVTSGVSYLYIRENYPDASVFKLGLSYPLPEKKLKAFAKKVKKLYVIEELEPFLEEELKVLGIRCQGKPPSWRVGELRPESIPLIVKGRPKIEEPATSRKPVMCPGCPHRQVFWVLKKLKAVVTGDIGCYTLGALPPLSSLHTCLCMGAGLTFLEGLKKAIKENVVGIIGDSTFVHAGMTGLVNLAYNKTKGLVIILDNATTAMTGSQPHPGTGLTIKGVATKKLILEDVCRACGADEVLVVDPFNVVDLEAKIRATINADKLTVLIARSPCRLVEKRRGKPAVHKAEFCKRCYLCLSLNCPAIVKDDDGSVRIIPEVCAGCDLCVSVCKFKAMGHEDV